MADKNLFGTELGNNANAFPAALDAWALAYIGWPIERDVDDKLTGELDKTATATHDYWEPKSLVFNVEDALDAASETADGYGWFSSVGWPGVDKVTIPPLLDSARKQITDMIEYLLNGDFSSSEDLDDGYWNPVRTDVDLDTDFPAPEAGESEAGAEPNASVGNLATIYSPHVDAQGNNAKWTSITPAITDWVNTTILDAIRDFIEYFINDNEVDAIVAKYRAAITAEYTMESQRATGLLHFAGACNTSPAALSLWRRTEEIERQVAAFRAELLHRMYPDATSIIGIFQTLANDAARIDNTKLQQNLQILQSNMSRMDAYLEGAIANASNETQASINNAQFTTQVNIENFIHKIDSEVRMILAALDARVKLGMVNDNTKLTIAQLLIDLYKNLALMDQQRASVIAELRREYQVNRLKMYMWKIELAETLMNASVIPLGVPMVPPNPSQFETRMATGIQTFAGIAGTLAPYGKPGAAIAMATIGALATMFTPRTIGD